MGKQDKSEAWGQRSQETRASRSVPLEPTETIDLDELFPQDLTISGSFDLRDVRRLSFGKLLGAIPLPVFLIDRDQQIVFASTPLNGFSREADTLVGYSFPQLFSSPGDAKRAEAILASVFENRKTTVFDGVVKLANRLLWSRIHLRSIRVKGDRLVLALIEDLTAEKRQLLVHEKYQRLVQVFPIGIGEFSLGRSLPLKAPLEESLEAIGNAVLISGNTEFARINGAHTIEELRGLPLRQLFPFGGEYDLLYRMWIRKQYPIRSFETKHETQEGVRYYENTLVPNARNDFLNGLWGTRQDITLRKQTEESLRNARDKLEERVRERTQELERMNEALRLEVSERQRAEEALSKLVAELQDALAQVKTLSGLLPICASCKKIRDDQGYWTQVEEYVRQRSHANFTHSICPECAKKLYPELFPDLPSAQ